MSNITVNATIESISDIGLMRITFNKNMSTLSNWTNLNSSNIDIWVAPYDNWHLKEENFDMKLINTTWNITDYNTSHIDIQLLFNSAPNISPT